MPENILVVGSTGYIASKLIPLLVDDGHSVRCLARNPDKLRRKPWFDKVQVSRADVTLAETLPAALEGISTAYYLVHNMSAGKNYAALDMDAAAAFGRAAKTAGVRRIVYLGGLADPHEDGLALHLASRIKTGELLRLGGVPVIEFRVGVIVGAGSVSFEMIRFIAEQFPVMVGPVWLRHRTQPASVLDVLTYLLKVTKIDLYESCLVDIGSQRIFSYIDIMSLYARYRGLSRVPVLLPLIPASLMAFFISILTPVEFSYALPLVEGLKNDSLVHFAPEPKWFGEITPMEYAEAVQAALAETDLDSVEKVWLEKDADKHACFHSGLAISFRREQVSGDVQAFLRTVQGEAEQAAAALGLENAKIVKEDSSGITIGGKMPGKGAAWLQWHLHHGKHGWMFEQTAAIRPEGLPAFAWLYANKEQIHRKLEDTLLGIIAKTRSLP